MHRSPPPPGRRGGDERGGAVPVPWQAGQCAVMVRRLSGAVASAQGDGDGREAVAVRADPGSTIRAVGHHGVPSGLSDRVGAWPSGRRILGGRGRPEGRSLAGLFGDLDGEGDQSAPADQRGTAALTATAVVAATWTRDEHGDGGEVDQAADADGGREDQDAPGRSRSGGVVWTMTTDRGSVPGGSGRPGRVRREAVHRGVSRWFSLPDQVTCRIR